MPGESSTESRRTDHESSLPCAVEASLRFHLLQSTSCIFDFVLNFLDILSALGRKC